MACAIHSSFPPLYWCETRYALKHGDYQGQLIDEHAFRKVEEDHVLVRERGTYYFRIVPLREVVTGVAVV